MTDMVLVAIPSRAGQWRAKASGEIIDVYPLEPVGGTLCVWGPDIGIDYTEGASTQQVWSTDEWQGHIPVAALGCWRHGPISVRLINGVIALQKR